MAKTVNDANAQNEHESEFARFTRAMKTILQVPKQGALKQMKQNVGKPKSE